MTSLAPSLYLFLYRRKIPLITEEQAEQIQYTLSEALETGTKIYLTLFGEYGDTVLEGYLTFDGRLRITTEEGIINVPLEKLVKAVLT
jgi:hypothetical protein